MWNALPRYECEISIKKTKNPPLKPVKILMLGYWGNGEGVKKLGFSWHLKTSIQTFLIPVILGSISKPVSLFPPMSLQSQKATITVTLWAPCVSHSGAACTGCMMAKMYQGILQSFQDLNIHKRIINKRIIWSIRFTDVKELVHLPGLSTLTSLPNHTKRADAIPRISSLDC